MGQGGGATYVREQAPEMALVQVGCEHVEGLPHSGTDLASPLALAEAIVAAALPH